MSLKVPLPGYEVDPGIEDRRSTTPSAQALTRLDYAVNASLLLAFACQRHGDRVGLLAFSDRVQRFATPHSGRRQFVAVADALYNLEAEPTEPDFGVALTYLATRNARRSLIVLFTDFSEPEGAQQLVSHAVHLARRYLLLIATVLDPSVRDLARADVTDSRSVYRRAVARDLIDTREAIRRKLRQAGILTVDTTADALTPAVINRYLEVKVRGLL
jgi:uncharacterized protein (DUF58 family)